MASILEVWDPLNNLVQLLYSTTDVNLVVSEYKNYCWKLYVLNQETMYRIQLNSEKKLIDIMVCVVLFFSFVFVCCFIITTFFFFFDCINFLLNITSHLYLIKIATTTANCIVTRSVC